MWEKTPSFNPSKSGAIRLRGGEPGDLKDGLTTKIEGRAGEDPSMACDYAVFLTGFPKQEKMDPGRQDILQGGKRMFPEGKC